MMLYLNLLLVVALGAVSASAQAPAKLALQVDKIFEKWNKPGSPGCAVAVMKDGRIAYERGYGMADLDHDAPITPTSVFHVASVSKQFTAAAIVVLAIDGKLSLDDPVRKYIPELPDFCRSITIRHLIHHTSGLRDQWELLELAGWRYSLDLITDEDVLDVISRQKSLNFKPGERHLYCNTGYTLLGQIVKRVSGQSLREFTTARLFQPLGMNNTHFRDDHGEIVRHIAYGYAPGINFRLSVPNFDTVGATGLLTTVEDLALWDENFYNKRIGGNVLVEQLQQRGKLNSGEQIDYAFGLALTDYKGLPVVEHGGADAGYRAHLIRLPEEHFSVACLCNTVVKPGELARNIVDLYLSKEIKEPLQDRERAQLTEQQLARHVGVYWNRENDAIRKVELREGKLFFSGGGISRVEMEPLSETRFRFANLPGELRFDQDRMTQIGARRTSDTFESAVPFVPTTAQLAEYGGAYTSEEIEAIFHVEVQDGKLVLKRLRFRPVILIPQIRDVFTSGGETQFRNVRFARDASNSVTGLVLNGDRLLNFQFTKQ